jgi:hypothetical protein
MAVHLSDAFETDELLRSENRRMSLDRHDNDPAWRSGMRFRYGSPYRSRTFACSRDISFLLAPLGNAVPALADIFRLTDAESTELFRGPCLFVEQRSVKQS